MTKIRTIKRETDLQIISGWIEPNSRVLDVGCGRGVLLEELTKRRGVKGLGVDIDEVKIEACVKRGVAAYQGDAEKLLLQFDEGHFDWVILSRTVQELGNPGRVIKEALRAGKKLAVGFENHGYYRNRLCTLMTGCASPDESNARMWPERQPSSPVSIAEFEAFCARENVAIIKRVHLAGDGKSEVRFLTTLRAAYSIYALSRAV
jgi:methionine biosynthesis protein MetW